MLVEMLDPNVSQLVLRLGVVDGDRAVLNQILYEEVSQGDRVCPRGVGAITGNVKRRRVILEERNTVEYILESSLAHHALAKCSLFHC